MTNYEVIITLPVGGWAPKICQTLMQQKFMVGPWLQSGDLVSKGTLADVIALQVNNVKISDMEFSSYLRDMLNKLEIAYFSIIISCKETTVIAASDTPTDRLPPNQTYDISVLN